MYTSFVVKYNPRLFRKAQIHPTIIKRVAGELCSLLENGSTPRRNREMNRIVQHEGTRYFVVYEFTENPESEKDDILYINEIRISK